MEKNNPEIIIVSKDGSTLIYCKGKVYGDHLTTFQFKCDGCDVEVTYTANELPLTGSDDVQRVKNVIASIMDSMDPHNIDGSSKLAVRPEQEWRRFELLAQDEKEIERFYSLLDEKNLSREDLAIILFSLRVRPGFERSDFGI